MKALGIRCSNKDFAYAVLDGSKSNPSLVTYSTISFPKGYATPSKLKWFLQELEDIIRKYSISSIAMKGTEGLAVGIIVVMKLKGGKIPPVNGILRPVKEHLNVLCAE